MFNNCACELATSGVETRRRGSDPAAVLATPRITGSSPANNDAGSSLVGRYNGVADGLSTALLAASDSGAKSTAPGRQRPADGTGWLATAADDKPDDV